MEGVGMRDRMNSSAPTGCRRARRALFASVLGAVVCAFVGVGSAGAALVTVGSPLTLTFSNEPVNSAATVMNSALGETGAHAASPVTGTVVSWHITQASGGPFYLSILTPDGGLTYTGAATSTGEVPTSTATQTYNTDLPIKTGQFIGLDNSNDGDTLGLSSAAPGSDFCAFTPPVADGSASTALGCASGYEVGFNADVQPLPTVTGLSRRSGLKRGGRKITIRGKNFDGTTAVTFGKKKAKSFKVVSDTRIHAVAPAHHAGVVHVTVYNPGKSAPSKGSKFKFKKSA